MKGGVRRHGNPLPGRLPSTLRWGEVGANMVLSRNAKCFPKSTLWVCWLLKISARIPECF